MRQPGKRTGVEDEGGGGGIVQENVATITSQLSLCLHILQIQRIREIKIYVTALSSVLFIVVRHILVPKPLKRVPI
jgi:hypothetical protein